VGSSPATARPDRSSPNSLVTTPLRLRRKPRRRARSVAIWAYQQIRPDPMIAEGEIKMAGQEQQQPQSRDTEVEEDIPEAPPAAPDAQASAATQGVDDLLDEIDGVLESNAEEFVRAFVQKGGQ
jgi:ubiquitin-like protein Pup